MRASDGDARLFSRAVPHEEGQESGQWAGYAQLACDGGCIPVLTSEIDLAVLDMAHKAQLQLKGRLGGLGFRDIDPVETARFLTLGEWL